MNGPGLKYPDIARIFGTGLISTGVGLLLFVGITVVWGDPFTRWSEEAAQQQLAKQLVVDVAPGTRYAPSPRLDSRLTRGDARAFRKSLPQGRAAASLRIPAIHLHKIVVKGAGPDELSKGPGFYDETGFPGSGLPVAIAGHRTTHGAPFLHIDELHPGDRIYLDLPYAHFVYEVSRTKIINPSDWSILDIGAAERSDRLAQVMRTTGRCPSGTCEHLVMTACHPKYSASQRIAVFSRLVAVSLRKSSR